MESPENSPNSVCKGVLSGPVADEAVELGKVGDSAVPGPDVLEQFSAILPIIQVLFSAGVGLGLPADVVDRFDGALVTLMIPEPEKSSICIPTVTSEGYIDGESATMSGGHAAVKFLKNIVTLLIASKRSNPEMAKWDPRGDECLRSSGSDLGIRELF